jgi:hypothetical protein
MNWQYLWGEYKWHIAIALISGLLNLPIAIKKLLNQCKAL